jgi:formylglycine-generating enzyme
VTNREFARFVRKAGYVTLAERARAEDYPGADPAMLVAGSSVFVPPGRLVDLRDAYNWWSWVPGTDWRHPQGPGSSSPIQTCPDRVPIRAGHVGEETGW